jgi:hypothetical protein
LATCFRKSTIVFQVSEPLSLLSQGWTLLKGAVNGFIEDEALTRGAAIAFYTATSFAPVIPENRIRLDSRDEAESAHDPARCLPSFICLVSWSSACSGRGAGSKCENLFLRHQLNIALRRSPRRLRLRGCDAALLVWMTRLWPSLLGLSRVVQPDTILRWHRAGFRAYWRWKSRRRGGRPRVSCELRELIVRMSKENPLWGAPRIHGELLKLGFEIAESTVSKYLVRRRRPPSQIWRTFLPRGRNADCGVVRRQDLG